MSTTQQSTETARETSAAATAPMKFEVTTLPVADVDRAKAFYEKLGWRLDIDLQAQPGHARGAVDPFRLAGVDPVRTAHDDDEAGHVGRPVSRRRGHRVRL